MSNQKACYAVSQAVKKGDLPVVQTLLCADCGNQAVDYDHRDYEKPLDVEPVCRSCNMLRGKAKGSHDIRTGNVVVMTEKTSKQLDEIVKHLNEFSVVAETKKGVVAKAIDRLHKRVVKK